MIQTLQDQDIDKWKDINKKIRGYSQHLQTLSDTVGLKEFHSGTNILDALKSTLCIIGAWRVSSNQLPISSKIASESEMSAMYFCIKSIYEKECDSDEFRELSEGSNDE